VPKRERSAGNKTRRDLNSEVTRRDVLRAARRLFGRHGYAGTSLAAVVRAANVTTGAVYHHFGDKRGLFRAVAEDVEAEILQRIAAAEPAGAGPWDGFLACTSAMFDICTEPDVQRIVFQDAPNVFGATEWREIEMRYGFGAMYEALASLKAAGVIRAGSVEVLAPILMGALIEAANTIARAEDKPATLAEARQTVVGLLESLRVTDEATPAGKARPAPKR
jgi:AcrR family transcriptional regulator